MGAAAGPASIGLSVASALFQGFSEKSADDQAAHVDRENAHLSLLQGALNEDAIQRRGRATQGEAVAALAADGGSVSGGSARDLIYQNSLNIEMAALGARYTAANEARGYKIRASQEKVAGTNAVIGSVLKAGAAAVSGGMQMRNQAALQNAYFPGGQQLPMPSSGGYSTPPYAGGHGPY